MKASFCFPLRSAAAVALLCLTGTGRAQIVFESDYNSLTPSSYASSYDTTDNLVLNTAASLGSVTSHGAALDTNFPLSNINDGVPGYANMTWFKNVGVGVDTGVDFNLNTDNSTGGSSAGFTIDDIRVAEGWDSAYPYFTNNDYTISYTLAGDATPFSHTLAIVDYNPAFPSSASTLVDLDTSDLTGVTAIRFDFTSLATGSDIGGGLDGPTVNQIVVLGVPTEASGDPIPEPSALALFFSGFGLLICYLRLRHRRFGAEMPPGDGSMWWRLDKITASLIVQQ